MSNSCSALVQKDIWRIIFLENQRTCKEMRMNYVRGLLDSRSLLQRMGVRHRFLLSPSLSNFPLAFFLALRTWEKPNLSSFLVGRSIGSELRVEQDLKVLHNRPNVVLFSSPIFYLNMKKRNANKVYLLIIVWIFAINGCSHSRNNRKLNITGLQQPNLNHIARCWLFLLHKYFHKWLSLNNKSSKTRRKKKMLSEKKYNNQIYFWGGVCLCVKLSNSQLYKCNWMYWIFNSSFNNSILAMLCGSKIPFTCKACLHIQKKVRQEQVKANVQIIGLLCHLPFKSFLFHQ